MLCAHFISVVRTADEIKEFGHWIRSGVRDFTLPGPCVCGGGGRDNTFIIRTL